MQYLNLQTFNIISESLFYIDPDIRVVREPRFNTNLRSKVVGERAGWGQQANLAGVRPSQRILIENMRRKFDLKGFMF